MAELRALMNAAKQKRAAQRDPPKFAKWIESGELQCLLCQKIVRDEKLWPNHLRTQVHSDAVAEWQRRAALKKVQVSQQQSQSQLSKSLSNLEKDQSKGESVEKKTAEPSSDAALSDKRMQQTISNGNQSGQNQKTSSESDNISINESESSNKPSSPKIQTPTKGPLAFVKPASILKKEQQAAQQQAAIDKQKLETQKIIERKILNESEKKFDSDHDSNDDSDDEGTITIVQKHSKAEMIAAQVRNRLLAQGGVILNESVIDKSQASSSSVTSQNDTQNSKRRKIINIVDPNSIANNSDQKSEDDLDGDIPLNRTMVGPMLRENFDMDDIIAEEAELFCEPLRLDATESSASIAEKYRKMAQKLGQTGGQEGLLKKEESELLLGSGQSGSGSKKHSSISGTASFQLAVVNANVPDGFFDDVDHEALAKGVTAPSKVRELESVNEVKRLEIQLEREEREKTEIRNAAAEERFREEQELEAERRIERVGELSKMRQLKAEELQKKKEDEAQKGGIGKNDDDDSDSSDIDLDTLDWRC